MKPLLIFVTLLPAVTAVFMAVMSVVMPPVFRHPEPLANSSAGNENSLAAMLVGLVFAMAAFLSGFGWLIARGIRGRGKNAVTATSAAPSRNTNTASSAPHPEAAAETAVPWERPADWWKKADE